MPQSALFQTLANAVLIAHVVFILFVVAGLLLVIVGGGLRWNWVRNLQFRLVHLAAIVFVVIESWLGAACPLTTLELWLRRMAGQGFYDGDFIAFWFRRLFFFDAPAWVFTVGYSAFGILVVLGWLFYPPQLPPRKLRKLAASKNTPSE